MEKSDKEKIDKALTEYKCYVNSFPHRAKSPFINIESIETKQKAKDRLILALRDIYPLLSIEDRKIFENFEKNSCDLNKIGIILQKYKYETLSNSINNLH